MTKKQPMDERVGIGAAIVVRGPFSESELPARSGPGEYFDEFGREALALRAGEYVQVDEKKICESRARNYLRTLASKDENYRTLFVRTATNPNGGRRHVFIGRRS
jgi:hypothetical protein